MRLHLCKLWVEEEGQTLVEYSLIIALISITLIAALGFVGGRVHTKYNGIGNSM